MFAFLEPYHEHPGVNDVSTLSTHYECMLMVTLFVGIYAGVEFLLTVAKYDDGY